MAAFYMAELNIIHPFREGNGRTTREFIRSLALKSGLIINWDSVTYDEILEASISSVHDITLLSLCIQKCILPLHLL
ncbi:MAG: Fic family protein [Clostridia bacterium]|nr:Fic family protein [Clostridia bacterium]